QIGGYPATQNSLLFKITDQLFCINIKLKLSAILVPAFSNYYAMILNKQNGSFQAIEDLKEITIADFFDGHTLFPAVLDQWIMELFSSVLKEDKIEELILLLERQDIQSVAELAAVLKINAKSLHRKTKRFFKLSPKELLSIVRFEKTAAYLKSEFANRLTDALRFGYYDQSHFNKESRRITGFSPKELFDRMCLSTHDLMLFDAEPA
nr:helix-turn-helix domain-containing protein [Saprospiraceae bacterium]